MHELSYLYCIMWQRYRAAGIILSSLFFVPKLRGEIASPPGGFFRLQLSRQLIVSRSKESSRRNRRDQGMVYDIPGAVGKKKFPGFSLDCAGNSCVRKPKQSTNKASEHKGRKVFSPVSTNGVNFVLSFILPSFFSLTICADFPFSSFHRSIYRCRLCDRNSYRASIPQCGTL